MGVYLDAGVGLLAYPGEIAGDFRLGAEIVDGVQFFQQGAVGEKAVQGFVAGLAEPHDFTTTFRLWDQVMFADLAYLPFAEGAGVKCFVAIHKNIPRHQKNNSR